MQARKLWITGTIFFALVAASGCSSTKKTEPQDTGDIQAAADAGTDAVPAAGPETTTAESAPPTTPERISPEAADAPPPAPSETKVAETTPPLVVEEKPSVPSSETYTVQQGDTLMKIAFEHFGDLYKWKDIYQNNQDKVKNPNLIYPGTVLVLQGPVARKDTPSGEKYLVKSGDTLGTIAKDVYGTPTKWKDLWKQNQSWIPDPNKIFAGFNVFYSKSDELEAKPAPVVEQAPPVQKTAPVAVQGVQPDAAPRAPAAETKKQ